MSMKFRFLNKTIQNQRFNYNPMYYDERKERLNRKRINTKNWRMTQCQKVNGVNCFVRI